MTEILLHQAMLLSCSEISDHLRSVCCQQDSLEKQERSCLPGIGALLVQSPPWVSICHYSLQKKQTREANHAKNCFSVLQILAQLVKLLKMVERLGNCLRECGKELKLPCEPKQSYLAF